MQFVGRRSRIHYPGAVYHAMARGVNGDDIFHDDHDRRLFLLILRQLEYETGCKTIAYCLMGNHFHWAIRIDEVSLSRVLQRLLTRYAKSFNIKYGRKGHLFQNRFKSTLCTDDVYLLGLVRYIHLNPVRSRFVSDPADWEWSSHLDYLGHRKYPLSDIQIVYGALSTISQNETYAQWMSNQTNKFVPWPSDEVVAPATLLRKSSPEEPLLIEQIAAEVSKEQKLSIESIRGAGRDRKVSTARRIIVGRAIKNGHPLTSIARWLCRTPGSLHYLLNGRNIQNNQTPDTVKPLKLFCWPS